MNPTVAECLKDIARETSRFMYRCMAHDNFPQPHNVEDYCDNIRAYVQGIELRKDIARDSH